MGLACEALETTKEAGVFRAFQRLFAERGVPNAVRSDEKRPEAKRHFVDFMYEVCRYAKHHGDIVVTLKIFDRDVDRHFLIGHFADAAEVAWPVAAECDKSACCPTCRIVEEGSISSAAICSRASAFPAGRLIPWMSATISGYC
jgi:hypothetical protein